MGAAVLTIAAILLALLRTSMSIGLPVAIGMAIAAALNFVLKHIIARSRPDILWLVTKTGYGFPSGHAMKSVVLYTMILLVVYRQVKSGRIRVTILLLLPVLPFLIGVSRVYLGVHNAGDVLAGWVLGIACAVLVDLL